MAIAVPPSMMVRGAARKFSGGRRAPLPMALALPLWTLTYHEQRQSRQMQMHQAVAFVMAAAN